MEKNTKLLQGNYCCIINGKLISVTEENWVFVELDLRSSIASVMHKECLKNRVEYIGSEGNAVYLVDMAGKWIAETAIDSAGVNYYKIDCNRKNTGNFAFICKMEGKIYLFLKGEPTVAVFDTRTKKAIYETLNIAETGICFDTGCIKGNSIYLFSSEAKKYYIYHITERRVIAEGEIPIDGRAAYVLYHQNNMYMLSRNTVYRVNKKFEIVAQINDPVYCSKICIAGNLIWFLPGRGERIYIYSMLEKSYEEYQGYPEDYEYDIIKGWGKFVGKTEDEDNIYWSMRANNYIMKIQKSDGKVCWIKPKIDNEMELIENSFFTKGGIIHEGICTFNDFLNHLEI